jgi:hypothetical protein
MEPVCFREVWGTMPNGWISPDELQGFVNLPAVEMKLSLTPCLAGETQDVDEILPSAG